MRARFRAALVLLAALAGPFRASAQAPAPVPALTGHVIDATGTLSGSEANGLEAELSDFEARKGSQVAVLIVASTQPEEIEQYSIRVAEQWKLGRKKVDDGAILLVAKDDHKLRIEVGYGLEGALTDAICKRIISEVITPYFKAGDFPGGLSAGVASILKVLDGEPLPPPQRSPLQVGQHRGAGVGLGLLALAFLISGGLRSAFGRVRGGLFSGGAVGLLASFLLGSVILGVGAGLLASLFTMLGGTSVGNLGNGSRRGGWGGGGFGGGWGSGGGGWGGGGGGGGFSGGGGGFGGGGASGSW